MFKQGKKERNELRLPTLHYIVADDWMEKLGLEAFGAWLKFHTWVDRRDEKREHDRIPYTLESTWEKLGMSKSKFYRSVIRPLWNFGLIDVVEYEASQRKTQKPKNIIVYESPMNKHETLVQPLEKIRDYATDYSSTSQAFGRKGGYHTQTRNSHGTKFDTVSNTEEIDDLHGIKNDTVDGIKSSTVTVSDLVPNNVLNNLLINTNKSTNDSNNHHPEIETAQQEVSATQEDQNMVVDVKTDVFNSFQIELSNQEITRLIKQAAQHKKNLSEVIQATKEHFLSTNKPINDLVASLMHGITKGWDQPKKAIVSKPLPQSIKASAKQDQNKLTEVDEADPNIEEATIDWEEFKRGRVAHFTNRVM